MEALKGLIDADTELVDWLIQASPNTDEERNEMKRVVALRGELDQRINELVLSRLKLAAVDLSDEIRKLNGITTNLRAAKKTIESVKSVTSLAVEVLNVAASIVAKV